ncbi:MAG: Hsp33 family molecular chaperone HslO [Pseudomonadota bacterium]
MSSSSASDLLHRFIFDDTDIRGEVASLSSTLEQLFSHQRYPPVIQSLLGEFLVATAILSSTLKLDGLVTLQARGNGPLPLIMAEANNKRELRGIAKLAASDFEGDDNLSLPAMIGQGILSITIDPEQGRRYQGIVPLDAATLAECIEHYFAQSEQLPTRLWLASDGKVASGLLLQQLPQQTTDAKTNRAAWENRIQLANTLTQDELLLVDHKSLLTRLFHEEGVRYFDPITLEFKCSCSKERSSRALQQLGQADAQQLLLEQGIITVGCEFCGIQFRYNQTDLNAIFKPETKQ